MEPVSVRRCIARSKWTRSRRIDIRAVNRMIFRFASPILVFVAWITMSSTDALAQGRPFVVIVNQQNQLNEVSIAKIKTIFLRRISRWPWGAAVDPVDLPD